MAPTGVAFPGRLGLSCITICQKKRTNLTGCTSQCLLIVELVAGQFSRLETAVSAEIWGWFIRGFVAADVEWESWIYFFFWKRKPTWKDDGFPGDGPVRVVAGTAFQCFCCASCQWMNAIMKNGPPFCVLDLASRFFFFFFFLPSRSDSDSDVSSGFFFLASA